MLLKTFKNLQVEGYNLRPGLRGGGTDPCLVRSVSCVPHDVESCYTLFVAKFRVVLLLGVVGVRRLLHAGHCLAIPPILSVALWPVDGVGGAHIAMLEVSSLVPGGVAALFISVSLG